MWQIIILMICCSMVDGSSILKRLKKEEEKKDVVIVMDRLNLDDVVPQDHIVGMKMERDGEENENYHKEVFLGIELEKFQNGNYRATTDQKKKLKEIFAAVDLNSDGIVDEKEMTDWVLTKTREHFYNARMNNERIVEMLDINEDDEISWDELLAQFLSENGMNKNDTLAQLEAGEVLNISKELEDKVDELRQKWIRVTDVGKKSLSVSQFFEFQHPETSIEYLKYLVEDILHDMDADNSNDITIQEYVAMPPDADVDAVKDIFVVERRKEFRNTIDRDKDGKVTVAELEVYLDPLSRAMAAKEARQLIGFGDSNEDGQLTVEEVLENSEFYTGSKLYNYAQSVHEEF